MAKIRHRHRVGVCAQKMMKKQKRKGKMLNRLVQNIFASITLVATFMCGDASAAPSVRQLGVNQTSGTTATKATTTVARSATRTTTPTVKKLVSSAPTKTAAVKTAAATSTSSDPIRLGYPAGNYNDNKTTGGKSSSASTLVFDLNQRVGRMEDDLNTVATKDDVTALRVEAAEAIVAATSDMATNSSVSIAIEEATGGLQNDNRLKIKLHQ